MVDSLDKHMQNEKELIRLRRFMPAARTTRARSAQFRLRRELPCTRVVHRYIMLAGSRKDQSRVRRVPLELCRLLSSPTESITGIDQDPGAPAPRDGAPMQLVTEILLMVSRTTMLMRTGADQMT